jgi:hypothetical protein
MKNDENLTGIELARANRDKKRIELGETPELKEEIAKNDGERIVSEGDNTITLEDKPKEDTNIDIDAIDDIGVIDEEVKPEVKDETVVVEDSAEVAKLKTKVEGLLKKLNDEDGKRGSQTAQTTALNAKLMIKIETLEAELESAKTKDVGTKESKADNTDTLYESLPEAVRDKWNEDDLKGILEVAVLANPKANGDKVNLKALEAKLEKFEKNAVQTESEKWFSDVEASANGFIEANKSDPEWHKFINETALGSREARREVLNDPNTKPSDAVAIYNQYLVESGKDKASTEQKPVSDKKTLASQASPRARTTTAIDDAKVTKNITTAQYNVLKVAGANANGDEKATRQWNVAKRLKATGHVI